VEQLLFISYRVGHRPMIYPRGYRNRGLTLRDGTVTIRRCGKSCGSAVRCK
jgi:hypothetical protein